MKKLDKLRIAIDSIDNKVLDLISKRAKYAKEIGALKKRWCDI